MAVIGERPESGDYITFNITQPWNYNYTYATTTNTFSGSQGRSNMNTEVLRLAAGYIGVVTTSINGSAEPIADTKPRKTYEAADRAVRKLALKIAKRAV